MADEKKTLQDLAALSQEELEELFQNGETPDPEKLAGWEFKGYNVPFFAKLLGIKKFKKGFYKHGDGYWGYNIHQRQNSIDEPWKSKPVEHNPKRFGFYSMKPVQPDSEENKEPGALILNYGEGKNMPWEGSFLRDYLKQPFPDNDDLFIGKAYVALGPGRIAPSLFLLERDRKAPTEVKHKGKY